MRWEAHWKEILDRDWDVIRGEWISHLPTKLSICARPDPPLSQFLSLSTQFRGIHSSTLIADVAGVRRTVFSEALFLFHKGLHVLRAAQRHATQGMPSWSLFSAYHSAYLMARSTMYLLGVAAPQGDSGQFIIDIFPQKALKHVRGKKKTLGAGEFQNIKIIPIPKLDQRYFWGTFQRVLRLAEVPIWDKELRDAISNLDTDKISPARNKFIYNPSFWPFDDLVVELPPELIVEQPTDDDLDPERLTFLFSLAFRVAAMAELLMFDLGKLAHVLASEIAEAGYIGEKWRTANSLYAEFLDANNLTKIRA